MAENGLLSRVIVGGKGAPITSQDIFRIASNGYRVELDKSRLEKISKNAKEGVNSLPELSKETLSVSSELSPLSVKQSKAFLVALLVETLNSSAITNPNVIHFLISLINNDDAALPLEFHSDAELVVEGLMTALQAPLKIEDAAQLKETISKALSVGISALAVHEGNGLLSASDAISALTCEAVQAIVTSFDSQSETASVVKGQSEVAADMRALLSGSTSVNPRKGGVDLPALSAVPQSHGSARESLKLANSAIRYHLNGASPDGGAEEDSSAAGSNSVSSSNVASCAASALQNILPVLARSRDRVAFLKQQLLSSSESPHLSSEWLDAVQVAASQADQSVAAVKQSCVDVAMEAVSTAASSSSPLLAGIKAGHGLSSALAEALSVLSLEAVLSLTLLGLREAERASKIQGGKEGKKGKKGGAQMGKGTAVVRSFLQEALAASADKPGTGELTAELDSVGRALSPEGERLGSLLAQLRAAIESNEARRVPKIPKGTRDFLPEQMAVRERVFRTITEAFKRHGGVEIDTPVFELRETLMGKYGEDSKLIYDLADQGGEVLSLRYDLTVPFARYLAMHPVGSIRRYHIGKVYRRDNPQMKRGRFREFYQCDFDIAGPYPAMIPDAEILRVLVEILDELALGDYVVKINHRGLLDGMLDLCGVPASKFRPICSAIDKLDKETWENVRSEMIGEKGLTPSVADKIGTFVSQHGPLCTAAGASADEPSLLTRLLVPGSPFAQHAASSAALKDLQLLAAYLRAMGAGHRVELDLSLARGLDYYTGMIFEAVFKPAAAGAVSVGSIAAGGRYDHLVGMFSGKSVPSVGMSVGVERVFTLIADKAQREGVQVRATSTQVLVASVGTGLLERRMAVAAQLWAAGIGAEYLFAVSPNMQKQLEYANRTGIPWMVLLGHDEEARGTVKVKDLQRREEEEVRQEAFLEVLQGKLTGAGAQGQEKEAPAVEGGAL